MDLLTTIWGWIISAYAKTIGGVLMWLTDFRKKWHEGSKVKYEAKEAQLRASTVEKELEKAKEEERIKKEVDNLYPNIVNFYNEMCKNNHVSQITINEERIISDFLNEKPEVIRAIWIEFLINQKVVPHSELGHVFLCN